MLRAYLGVLDRLPDAGGLAGWTAARASGLSRFDLVGRFVASPEFQRRFGALPNRGFVDLLHRASLDRPADADGLAHWA